jgi:nitroreductase
MTPNPCSTPTRRWPRRRPQQQLQGAYLILAARALGLDAGPQSGFNPAAVDAAFFPDGRYRVPIVNLGVGVTPPDPTRSARACP